MIDKTPLKSKKFIAYLIADIGWKIILFFMIVRQSSKLDHYTFLLLITLVIVSGFIQVGYILGQAALDKYTKVTGHLTQATKEPEKK
jgi:hypothetical protein